VGAGDEITVIQRPQHGVTVGKFANAYLGDRGELEGVLAAEELSEKWREWIIDALAKRASKAG
jgi:MOSC domain-containing protein YiiM